MESAIKSGYYGWSVVGEDKKRVANPMKLYPLAATTGHVSFPGHIGHMFGQGRLRITVVAENPSEEWAMFSPHGPLYANTNLLPEVRFLGSEVQVYNERVRETIHRYISGLFLAHRDLLEAVYLTDSADSQLLYSIVLKEDTFENRSTLFGILEEMDIDSVYPGYSVHFQFYPQGLKEKVQYVAALNL